MNEKSKEKWWTDWRLVRNILLFTAGMIGLASLTIVWIITNRTPDSSLLIVFSGMLGLPIFLVRDEKEK